MNNKQIADYKWYEHIIYSLLAIAMLLIVVPFMVWIASWTMEGLAIYVRFLGSGLGLPWPWTR